jgi:uncharacterized Rmd1/YagE family protein
MEPLGAGSYKLRAVHMGASFDMVAAARETVGTLAPGKSHLFIKRTGVLYFLFPFGAVVSVALTPGASEPDLSEFRKLVSTPHEQVTDEFIMRVTADEKEGVEFGQVKVREGSLDRLSLVAAILAQSNTLEHYERVVAAMTEDTAGVTDRLSQGKMPPKGSEMLVFIGRSLGIRRELVSQLSVLDPPESIWDDDSLDRLYHALQNNFEIPQRMRVVEHKLELIHDTAQMVVSINEGRHSHFLEKIVIFLIALEIVLAILGH